MDDKREDRRRDAKVSVAVTHRDRERIRVAAGAINKWDAEFCRDAVLAEVARIEKKRERERGPASEPERSDR